MFDAGRDRDTGRRRQRWQRGFRTKREAEAELSRQLHQIEEAPTPSRAHDARRLPGSLAGAPARLASSDDP
ncbi:MAG: Arm DNA-binding domain-containing protein [Acidimicrobiales bacterium]